MGAERRALGVLVPPYDADPGHPGDRPIGRAALQLEAEGCPVVFGHRSADGALAGVRATPRGWVETGLVPLAAAYDRFPSRSRAADYGPLRAGLQGVPLANPPSLVELCADKARCSEVLRAAGHDALPAQEHRPAHFARCLEAWGAAFLKPRFGAFGAGVRRVDDPSALSDTCPGPLDGAPEPAVLQQAIPAPDGWAGVACRVLVQRTPDGWWAEQPVARLSRDDVVVNASRGAQVHPLQDVFPQAFDRVREVSIAAARALAAQPHGAWLVEVGVDVVLDRAATPWVIEVNSRPRGRLEALLKLDRAWHDAHVAACARPLRTLWQLFSG